MRRAGDIAGWKDAYGYWNVRIFRKNFKAHRVIWRLTHGSWPPFMIDHINGNAMDNRPCNLRGATSQQNQANRKGARKDSKTGIRGVHFNQKSKRWEARINVGNFATAAEAEQMRDTLEQVAWGSFNRPRLVVGASNRAINALRSVARGEDRALDRGRRGDKGTDMAFHVGQLVVCVDDDTLPGEPGPYVREGVVYTVASVLWEPTRGPWGAGECQTLLFAELKPNVQRGWCTGYDASHFRPITDEKLAVFRQHLAPSPKQTEPA